jgi:putative ABC transport system substrate-binding protein
MKRRDFITFFGGATVGWPLARDAQAAVPTIGFIGANTAADRPRVLLGFNRGLGEAGYVDGQNCTIEYRWAQGHYDRMPQFALELVRMGVDVIAAAGGTRSIQSAKLATRQIPIVFVTTSDPVQLGLVSNLDRPADNLTGVTFLDFVHIPKRLELIRELLPNAGSVGALFNPNNAISPRDISELWMSAKKIGLQVEIIGASDELGIDAAFATVAARRISGLVILPDPFLLSWRAKIIGLASRERLPMVGNSREFAESGGTMSYGADVAEVWRHAGSYAGRILKGEKPADLRVLQANVAELVVNLGSAKALGITIPASILRQADGVIE